MSTITIKENSIQQFVGERKVSSYSANTFGFIGNDERPGTLKKINNKHLHNILTPELFFKKGASVLPGDTVLFELQDILQGSEEIKDVTYSYTVEEYDDYSLKLTRANN